MTEYGFRDYQHDASMTIVNSAQTISYMTLGLVGEAGEVANKVKKFERGDYDEDRLRELVADELGDVLWYIAGLATVLSLDLDEIALDNISKVLDRKSRGVILGDGDDR